MADRDEQWEKELHNAYDRAGDSMTVWGWVQWAARWSHAKDSAEIERLERELEAERAMLKRNVLVVFELTREAEATRAKLERAREALDRLHKDVHGAFKCRHLGCWAQAAIDALSDAADTAEPEPPKPSKLVEILTRGINALPARIRALPFAPGTRKGVMQAWLRENAARLAESREPLPWTDEDAKRDAEPATPAELERENAAARNLQWASAYSKLVTEKYAAVARAEWAHQAASDLRRIRQHLEAKLAEKNRRLSAIEAAARPVVAYIEQLGNVHDNSTVHIYARLLRALARALGTKGEGTCSSDSGAGSRTATATSGAGSDAGTTPARSAARGEPVACSPADPPAAPAGACGSKPFDGDTRCDRPRGHDGEHREGRLYGSGVVWSEAALDPHHAALDAAMEECRGAVDEWREQFPEADGKGKLYNSFQALLRALEAIRREVREGR